MRWGVLGTGSIARTVAAAHPGAFVAAASRDAARAAAFGLPIHFGSYEDLLACDATAYEALTWSASRPRMMVQPSA